MLSAPAEPRPVEPRPVVLAESSTGPSESAGDQSFTALLNEAGVAKL